MNNWQEWIVGILIVLCVSRIVYSVFIFFRRAKENNNPCLTCVSGCELKNLLEKKRMECKGEKKSIKKKCCR